MKFCPVLLDNFLKNEILSSSIGQFNKGNKKYFIQVAYSVAEEKAYNREFGAFAKLDNTNQKIIITNDDIDYSTSTVRHIRLKDFLLMDSLDN